MFVLSIVLPELLYEKIINGLVLGRQNTSAIDSSVIS